MINIDLTEQLLLAHLPTMSESNVFGEMFSDVLGSVFYSIFKQLEEEEKLDPLNEIDLYCLHRVFLPQINVCLGAFVESWNNHSISIEQNMSSNQLFIHGALQQDEFIDSPYNPNDTINIPDHNEEVTCTKHSF